MPLSDLLHDEVIADAPGVSEKVRQAFNQLDVEYQELLLLKYIDNKHVKEIAAEIGRSVKAVEADLFRARQAFKAAYLAMPA